MVPETDSPNSCQEGSVSFCPVVYKTSPTFCVLFHKWVSIQVFESRLNDMSALIEDPWKQPATTALALIGVLFVSIKIFSFWRLIASLFILPGVSVGCLTKVKAFTLLIDHSSQSSGRREHGPSLRELLMALARNMPYSSLQRGTISF